jgi:hypothetical protein
MSAAASSLATPETTPRTRAEINRANSQHSTGPRTAEGKARASMNALKHGMFAGEVVLPGEDPQAFQQLTDSYARECRAETSEELSIVHDIVSARWRARRISARETALTILTTEQQRAAVEKMFDADDGSITALAQAAGLQANARLFNQLWLAEARLFRRAELAETKLLALVKFRQTRSLLEQSDVQEIELPALIAQQAAPPRPPPAAAAPTDSGFVPPLSSPTAFPAGMPKFTGPLKKEKLRQWLRQHGHNDLAKAA